MLTQTMKKNLRHEKIMLSLDNLNYATRKQLQIINGLGGTRNAQRILQRMEKEGLIKSERLELKIYYLSDKGKQLIGSGKGDLKKSQIIHTLMRNDLFIKLGMPKDWKKEVPLKLNKEVILISDAIFKKNGINHFVEIDNKQSMKNNKDKISKYKEIFPAIYKQFGHHPVLIWYTLSEIRKKKLKETCTKTGVKFVIY